MIEKKNALFLLGGYDLEMDEIKKLLDEHQLDYRDKKLSWGAKLSEYKEYLNFDGHIYGIELEQDIQTPQNYVEIDHHNKNIHKESSLEQIANLLNIKLNRYQMLVAKNDSAFIKGMKSVCASEDEIKEIRAKDRKVQGVTPDDEYLAKLSISASNGSNIIFAKTDKFTAISDAIYKTFSEYIIYNELTASFYGYKIVNLIKFLETHNLSKDDIYYGGGEFGYLGIKKGVLTKEKIQNLLEEFDKMQDAQKVHSHHTFMFPFIFDIDDKESIKKSWTYKPYENNYNEATYFHKFFKDSMFTKEEGSSSDFYTQDGYKNAEFIICKSEEYKLKLQSVNLRLFSTGVGILSFHVENYHYTKIQYILEINEFGRRIYPEYLDEKNECTLVPNFVEIKTKTQSIRENFKDFSFGDDVKELQLSKIITHFLPVEKITPAVDDRMFVISFYKNNNFANDLKIDYKKNDKWYEYVFVDANGKTVQNDSLQEKLITNATYTRWQNYGTMFGLSKYSFVCLADSDFVLEHIKTMYFQMLSLLLMQRATILQFSSEVSCIALKIGKEDTATKVEVLYKRYIQFVNRFYFREITPKDQGLEIYELGLKTLNIQRDIKDLDAEIEELHKFVELQTSKKEAKTMEALTWIGAVLLPPSIVTGFLGMNTLGNFKFEHGGISLFITIASAFILPISFWVTKFLKRENHE